MAFCSEEEIEGLHLELTESEPESEPENFNPSGNLPKSYKVWKVIQEFASAVLFESFLITYSHKMTATHGSQVSRCAFHSHKHKQTYGYYKCTSSKCIKDSGDSCSYQLRVNECSQDQIIRIYQVGI